MRAIWNSSPRSFPGFGIVGPGDPLPDGIPPHTLCSLVESGMALEVKPAPKRVKTSKTPKPAKSGEE